MWGCNHDETVYHYFESLADRDFICGGTQRVKYQKISGIPDKTCARCLGYYKKHVEPRLQTVEASAAPVKPSNLQPQTTPVTTAASDCRVQIAVAMPAREDTTSRDFEERRLQLVLNTITGQIGAVQQGLNSERQERKGTGRKDFNEEAVINNKYKIRHEMLEKLRSMQAVPYHGRVDFLENGCQKAEIIYVGKSTLYDTAGDFLIYDWRNPIGRLYYQYDPGSASYWGPEERFDGEVLLKRSYEIKNGQIIAIYDASGRVEGGGEKAIDGMLASLLQRNTTGKMREIVQSIQAEQDRIIRSKGDVVVVQGPAGSGKTIIALHRAAYLLYTMRQERELQGNVSAQRMVAFSPNKVFADYISRVLPDLYEGRIGEIILEQFLLAELRTKLPRDDQEADFQIQSRESHFETSLHRIDANKNIIRSAGASFKSSAAMLHVLNAFFQEYGAGIEAEFRSIYYAPSENESPRIGQSAFFSQEEMRHLFRIGHDAPLTERIDRVLAEMNRRVRGARNSRTIGMATVSYLEQERRNLEMKLRPFRGRNPVQLYEQLWNTPELLAGAVAWREEEEAETKDSPDLMQSDRIGGYWLGRIAQHTLSSLQARKILHEDIVPLLLMAGIYSGFPRMLNIDHAVIDEAQDYSLVHYEYLRRCLPERCSLTIVGDMHQAINPLLNIGNYDRLKHIFGERISRMELTRSYRSSLEITEFASRILPGNTKVESVRQTGSRPKLVAVSSATETGKTISALIKQLSEAGYNSIAIVCKTRSSSEALYRQLRETSPVSLLTGETGTFSQGVFVTPLLLAKGLEFDAVIIPEVSNAAYSREEERKMLYTASTRALHELYLCCCGAVSPLLPAQDSGLYEEITI